MVGPDAGPDGSAAFTRRFPRRFPAGLSRHHPARCIGKGMKMPGKIQAFRELPDAMRNTTMLAVLALFVSVAAMVIAMGARHAS